MPYPSVLLGLGLAGILIIRCATTPIHIYPSCLVFSSCDSDVYIINLFVSVVVDWPVLGLVVGRVLSPHYFNISVVEAGNCRTEKPYSFVPFGRCSAISLDRRLPTSRCVIPTPCASGRVCWKSQLLPDVDLLWGYADLKIFSLGSV